MTNGLYDYRLRIGQRGGSVYSVFHEWAHVEQQSANGIVWRIFERLHRVPFIGHLALLACEVQAAWMARKRLMECGCWGSEDRREALMGLATYIRRCFI